MSNDIQETPIAVPSLCPTCNPDTDTRTYSPHYCAEHAMSSQGTHDRLVDQSQYLSGSGEAYGEDNRRWCDFFHRNRGKR